MFKLILESAIHKTASSSKSQRWITMIRWMGVIPISFGAAWIIWFVTFHIIKAAPIPLDVKINEWAMGISLMIIPNISMGASTVLIGAEMAPSNKGTVAWIIAGIELVLVGIFAGMILMDEKVIALKMIGLACVAGSAIASAIWKYRDEEIEKSRADSRRILGL